MNCIDAIEGTLKKIIDHMYENFISDQMDDTEYIRNVKVVIEAVNSFINENREIASHPEVVKKILYEYARDKWIAHRPDSHLKSKTAGQDEGVSIDFDYFCYYFDHIYDRGVQPY